MFRLNGVEIDDTFAELFEMWAARVLITAKDEKWALTAANAATGFASSIIGCPAEAGVERIVGREMTPDKRVGAIIQIYHGIRSELKKQMIKRIGQCIMTCPTTSIFDFLPNAIRRLKVGRSLRLFGDGFQRRDEIYGRRVWRIPVMEGEFIIEESFGVKKAIAGGNFIILAETQDSALLGAEEAVKAIRSEVEGVILPFPGGICRSGSKVGSLKYKLPASTNHLFCPILRDVLSGSNVTEDANCVYEIVVNGLNLDCVKKAMAEGIKAAAKVKGVVKISAGNYGGKIGPIKVYLHDILRDV
ncbi:MAG: formylmethanofuran--tetrahydromethanopterin N-formyltransferase [Nitrososphaerota archaeon]|nr:formylmethanofuran--tetrahydromethanopterin N-formyltransferase [Candidatus Bathyarchaeota archaeon]MDW8048316.1 formylmethanofuran--tetrahydromethanopterin N-formyltransferase [Nitrososphaerota archaeon]